MPSPATDVACEVVLSPSSAYSTCPPRPGGLLSPSAPRGSCPILPSGTMPSVVFSCACPATPFRAPRDRSHGSGRGRRCWSGPDALGLDHSCEPAPVKSPDGSELPPGNSYFRDRLSVASSRSGIWLHVEKHKPRQGEVPPGAALEEDWWERAAGIVPRLLGAGPAPEPVRFVDVVSGGCPAERPGQLHPQVRITLGTPSPAAVPGKTLLGGTGADQKNRCRRAALLVAVGCGTGRRPCPTSCWPAGSRCGTGCAARRLPLDAFYLTEAAAQADRPDAFPDGTITAGVTAALVLRRV